MRILKGLVLMALMTIFSGCSAGGSIDHYADYKPEIKLEEFFNGPIKAWGIVQDRSGKITRSFSIDMVGSWENGIGTLKEDFDYYDGETQQRVWTIKKIADGKYQGEADDIIGTAEGRVVGNTAKWAYQMNIDVGDNTYKISFDDWMFQMRDGVVINRAYLKKFGIKVAELSLFMQKQDQK